MAIFQILKGDVYSISNFDRGTVPGFDSYETPLDYAYLPNEKFKAPEGKNKFITVHIGGDMVEQFVADPDILKLTDNHKVDVIFAGRRIVAVLNKREGYYCCYQQPLYKKFILPKVLSGLNFSVVSLITGYMLHLIALKTRSETFEFSAEIATALFIVVGIVYAAFYHYNLSYAKKQMFKFLKVVEGLKEDGV